MQSVKCELLAPAGNPEMLHAAIDGGADAAYLGLQSFNARRNARNFDFESLESACEYAHLRGAHLYVAMNTIVFQEELEEAVTTAVRANSLGADAFIVQDLGLALAIKEAMPNARLHASTQMSIHSLAGLRMANELGFSRVTLAREMSLGEIESMCEEAGRLGLEIETFAHGALCVSYSGQCLMSSLIGCRSANRGLCAQPCRLEYELVDLRDPEKEVKSIGCHLLSPKDLCSIDDLEDLVRMGVASLKIEGRMKSAEYTYTVVSVYRGQLDSAIESVEHGRSCPAPDPSAREKLGSVFSRGFSGSYLDGNRGNSMMSYQRPNNRGQFVGRVKSVDDSSIKLSLEKPLKAGDSCEIWTHRGNAIVDIVEDSQDSKNFRIELGDTKARNKGAQRGDLRPSKGDRVFRIRSADAAIDISPWEPRIPVSGNVLAKIGSPLQIEFRLDYDGSPVSRCLKSRLGGIDPYSVAAGHVVESARTKSITKDEIREHVDRMGQSPFKLLNLDVDLDDGVGMGYSQIHKVRSEALESLKHEILKGLGYASPACGKSDVPAITRSASTPNRPHARSCNEADEADLLICAYVSNPECARVARRNGADRIYVGALNYKRGGSQLCGIWESDASQAGYPKHCVQVMGPISHDASGLSREAVLGVGAWDNIQEGSSVLIESLDGAGRALERSCSFEIGPDLPIVNDRSLEVSKAIGASRVWLSSELSLKQIEGISERLSFSDTAQPYLGIVVSGAQELMKCEHCVLMGVGDCDENCLNCSRRKVPFALRDRMGYEFPVLSDSLGRSHIFNSVNTDNMNSIPRLIDCGIRCFMVNAQLMDPEQTAQEVSRLRSALKAALAGNTEIKKRKGTTTGHFHRPVA